MSNLDDGMFNEDDYKDDVTQEPSNQDDQTVDEQPKDLTAELLKIRGIEDSSKIKFEDETGTTIERSWDDLSDNANLSANDLLRNYLIMVKYGVKTRYYTNTKTTKDIDLSANACASGSCTL